MSCVLSFSSSGSLYKRPRNKRIVMTASCLWLQDLTSIIILLHYSWLPLDHHFNEGFHQFFIGAWYILQTMACAHFAQRRLINNELRHARSWEQNGLHQMPISERRVDYPVLVLNFPSKRQQSEKYALCVVGLFVVRYWSDLDGLVICLCYYWR